MFSARYRAPVPLLIRTSPNTDCVDHAVSWETVFLMLQVRVSQFTSLFQTSSMHGDGGHLRIGEGLETLLDGPVLQRGVAVQGEEDVGLVARGERH